MKKIVTLRGTSGSGKTTLVKNIMALYPERKPVFIEGRKRPLYYILRHPEAGDLAVLGNYEIACGGCDTIQEADTVYNLIRQQASVRNVLFEGLLLGCDINRTKALDQEIHMIYLNTPIEDCLSGINARRLARGVAEPVNPENTVSKFKGVKRAEERSRAEIKGAQVFNMNREEAFAKVREILGV